MHLISKICVSVLFFSVAGCSQGDPTIDEQAKEQKTLAKRLAEVEGKVALMQLESLMKDDAATVSTEENTYGVAKTNFGQFPVIARNLTPYLDGYKAKIGVGNLSTAQFNGAKMTVSWGPPYDENKPNEYASQRKSKQFDLTTVFLPGNYGYAEVVLTPATAAEVKSLSIQVIFNSISLRNVM
ncbi:MAG: hypothetical protein JWL63_1009 [Rhodocyclales bacterium]|nr:hypothetical protein [Rhodocyclales bacterium]